MLEFSNLVFVVYQQMKKYISSPVVSAAWTAQAQSRKENSYVYSAEVVDFDGSISMYQKTNFVNQTMYSCTIASHCG